MCALRSPYLEKIVVSAALMQRPLNEMTMMVIVRDHGDVEQAIPMPMDAMRQRFPRNPDDDYSRRIWEYLDAPKANEMCLFISYRWVARGGAGAARSDRARARPRWASVKRGFTASTATGASALDFFS